MAALQEDTMDETLGPKQRTGVSEIDLQKQDQEFKFQSHESFGPQAYQIKPSLEDKFKEIPVKEIIRDVVSGQLAGKNYEADKVKKWTITIANDVNERVRGLLMTRYRHIVQVIIGEMKGAGVRTGARCIWDCECDAYTSEVFMNDTMFCLTTVFAVYLY